ncbi:MAG: hypothetical protein QOF57_1128 [Frankiaceae bacterium]|jgi:uncharacterized protein with FMN-binding domain|nr:hypothetical protein [Frankiaceae bacterium]
MRRITIWLSSTAAILVLLFSYRTSTMGAGGGSLIPSIASGVGTSDIGGTTPIAPPASPTSTAPAGSGTSTGSTSGGAKKSTGSTPAATPSASPTAQSGAAKVVTGQTVDTRWGPVQVAITVQNKKITAVAVPVYPDGNNRDAEINSYALPQLVQETLSAQSAHINVVSGASVTSDGYISSLQSAIDAAQL